MKTVILAGGRGSRISEETVSKPKVLVEIGGKPILWHLLKSFSGQGFNDFIICLGYKGHMIKEYFYNYSLHHSDFEINLKSNAIRFFQSSAEDWNVTLVDTSIDANTGRRLKLIESHIDSENFFFTYGDGLANVNLDKLLAQHLNTKNIVTLTAVTPPGRFGVLEINNEQVTTFQEKANHLANGITKNREQEVGGRINGGFFVINRKIFEILPNLNLSFEFDVLPNLATKNLLGAYHHNGFWQAMDTLRDKEYLENYVNKGKLPWLI